MQKKRIEEFRRQVWRHYRARGRHGLPWRRTRDPYRILVSEVMLQQTQVARVIPKYRAFVERFPGFPMLAAAPASQILRVWQGLGYNRRALALKRLAEKIVREYGGTLPREREALEALPGVGPATAGAVATFAFNLPAAFLETNIRRAFIHFFFPRRRNVLDEEILKLASIALDRRRPREWHWALMDYGASLGRELPKNPNERSARYRRQAPFRGSDRELRGEIVRRALNGPCALRKLSSIAADDIGRIRRVVSALRREGLVEVQGGNVIIKP